MIISDIKWIAQAVVWTYVTVVSTRGLYQIVVVESNFDPKKILIGKQG